MNNLIRIWYLVLMICLFFQPALFAEELIIQVHLFRSERPPNQANLNFAILTGESRKEIEEIETSNENILATSTIRALMNIYELEAIDHLLFFQKEWSGKRTVKIDDSVQVNQMYYRIDLAPKRLSSQNIFLHIRISSGFTPRASKMSLLNHDIDISINNPTIFVIPLDREIYYALVLIKSINTLRVMPKLGHTSEAPLVNAPPIIKYIQPSYPEELRRRRIGGIVDLIVQLDRDGHVQSAILENPSHPYLSFSAIRAIRQCLFEPSLIKGKPTAVKFRYSFAFYPDTFIPEKRLTYPWESIDPSLSAFLNNVLDSCGDYALKLEKATMDFVCEETIKETHYSLLKDTRWVPDMILTDDATTIARWRQIVDPAKTIRRNILCDYQIVRKEGNFKEQRIILKENGRLLDKSSHKLLEEGRVVCLSPLFAPMKVLLPDRQKRFYYRIATEDRVQGREAYVIEAIPKYYSENEIWEARIWVDKTNYRIMRCEIHGIPIEGYEDVLNDCAFLNIVPEFVITYEYKLEKNGILFPSKTKVHISYPGTDFVEAVPKADISITYSNYKFFSVESEYFIKKNNL